jgi:transketolase
VALAREKLGWKYPPFEIPKEIYQQWDARKRGEKPEQTWNEQFAAYRRQYPELAASSRQMSGALPENWAIGRDYIANCRPNPAKIASRKASQNALNAYGPHLPELLGGSADLAPSNLTIWKGSTSERGSGG